MPRTDAANGRPSVVSRIVVFVVVSVVLSASLTDAWAPPRRIRAIWNRQVALKPIPPVSWPGVPGDSRNPAATGFSPATAASSTQLGVLAERPTDLHSGGNGFDNNNSNRKAKNRRKQNNKNRRRRRVWEQDDHDSDETSSTAASASTGSTLESEVEHEMSLVAEQAEREYKHIREEESLKLFFERHDPLPITEPPVMPRTNNGKHDPDGIGEDLHIVLEGLNDDLVAPSVNGNNGHRLHHGRRSQQQQKRKKRSLSSASDAVNGSGSTARKVDRKDGSALNGASATTDSVANKQATSSSSVNGDKTNGDSARTKQESGDSSESQGFKIPQIHLPTRLLSRIGWEQTRQATTNFMQNHFGKDGEDSNGPNGSGKRNGRRRPSDDDDDDDDDPEIFHVAVDASVSDDLPTFIASHKKKNPKLVSSTNEWKRLEAHAHSEINRMHLRNMLQDEERCNAMYAEHDGVYLDYSRQRANLKTMQLLQDLAKKQKLQQRIRDMMMGKKINFTEKRPVLHTALRCKRDHEPIMVDGVNVVEEVHEVLDQIKAFTDGVRAGTIRGHTGKRLRNIISVGIGGSYLGPEFLHEVLKTEPEGVHSALGYTLRFLANVDPVDVERTCADLDPEETLIIVVSKTFTTAETMLNAKIMRQWLWDFMGEDPDVVRKHIVACASVSATRHVRDFGIDTEGYFFKFWDWVGGRYSVCSAAGAVPISLLYGYDVFEKFLKGANSIDEHFATAPFDRNIPVIMGLLGVWNMSFMKYKTRTTLPYAEALLKLPAHIQQLDMESNGKVMTRHGVEADYPVGEIDFGEPGTNGQHSFFQLLHMGQTCPCDFIGFCQSQHDLCLDDEHLSSHDELMANFFAQPDALAYGKTADQVRAEGVPEELVPHRTFKGNRPSMSLLFPKLTAYATGQLLAIYEHRTTVQGFIWDINSFDQWGVELGKKLAIDVKNHLLKARQMDPEEQMENPIDAGNVASSRILNYYVRNSENGGCPKEIANQRTRVTRKTHADHYPLLGIEPCRMEDFE